MSHTLTTLLTALKYQLEQNLIQMQSDGNKFLFINNNKMNQRRKETVRDLKLWRSKSLPSFVRQLKYLY